MKSRIKNSLSAVCLLLAAGGSGFPRQGVGPPCGEPADLLRDHRGKPVWYTAKQMKKRVRDRVLAPAPLLHMRGQFVVALLVDAGGKVGCAKSMNRHPLAVKTSEERAGRLTFKPVQSKGKPVSVYGLLTLRVEYGSIRIN